MTSGYNPVYNYGGNTYSAMYYAGGGSTIIHYAVSSYGVSFADYVYLQGSGAAAGYYTDGTIAQAYRPDFRVIFSNGAGDSALGGTGDWPRLMANSCAAQYYLGY
jgi:hypothetical protein